MSTKINYCDETVNPITGCSKCSPGCLNCYAEKLAHRLKGRFGYGEDPFKVTFHHDKLNSPGKWKSPKVIFVCSMGDIFHADVEVAWVDQVFAMIKRFSQHQYLILTKRAQRMHDYVVDYEQRIGALPSNAWLGVTIEDQVRTNERLPLLLNTPATHHFVSVEPMLEPVSLNGVPGEHHLDWVICGGESGLKARYMNPDWARYLRDQCAYLNIAFYMKQMSQNGFIPQDLFVRQLPAGLR